MRSTFRHVQIRMMLLCWVVYAMAYFGRLNLSIAIPGLQTAFSVGKAEIGLIGTLFFWFYGVGQLLGGTLGDRLPARRLVAFGLVASAACNLLFGFTRQLGWLYVVWALNGVFQSLLWCPIVKTIARWHAPERRSRAVVLVSTSMVGGFLLAWGLLGYWAGLGSVRLLFLVPAVSMAATAILWFSLMRDCPADLGWKAHWEMQDALTPAMPAQGKGNLTAMPVVGKGSLTAKPASLWSIALASNLWLIIVACFAQGIIRDGITLWAPTFFMEAHGLSLSRATASSLFLPMMNFGGILLSGWLAEKLGNRVELATAILFLASMGMLGAMILFGQQSIPVAVVFLGLASGLMYGVNTLLVGIVPMQFERYGRSSSISGLLNFLAYMAAGFASAFTGWLVDTAGWNGVLVSWVLLAAIGMAALVVHERTSVKNADARPETRQKDLPSALCVCGAEDTGSVGTPEGIQWQKSNG